MTTTTTRRRPHGVVVVGRVVIVGVVVANHIFQHVWMGRPRPEDISIAITTFMLDSEVSEYKAARPTVTGK